MAPIILNFIAKSPLPTPFSILSLAYYLQSLPLPASDLKINFVFALPGNANVQLEIDGTSIAGESDVLKKLGDTYAAQGLCGTDANSSVQISSLLLLLPSHPWTFATTSAFLARLEQKLTLRTFLVGHELTMGDYAAWGAVRGSGLAVGLLGKCPNVGRWFNHLSTLPESIHAVEELATQYKAKPPKETPVAGEAPKANATFELGLPNAIKGGVVTRFPPEPSGYLHIGHAKAAILNQYFARHYEGRFLVRFDDTNPSKEKAEFEQSIIEDLELLGIKGDGPSSYTSDFFDELHIRCVRLIKDGNAYADDTEQLKMRKERWDGIASENREMTSDTTLEKFALMASGSTEGARWCIRAKVSADDPNKAMRDPVIYRCNALPHHRTGDKFKVYPTYDFACPIVDCLQGVTHALRTNEYRDRNPLYQWMLEKTGLRKIEIWDYGRISFVYTLLSKRKLKDFVERGNVRGWDDPRFATVRGIRRRGMSIEALTQYMLLQGPSQAVTCLEWDTIWSINKRIIDPVAPRYVALNKENLVPVKLIGAEVPKTTEMKVMPRHKKNADIGTKETFFTDSMFVEQEDALSFADNEEITLMDWGNAFVREIVRSTSTPSIITSITMELNLTGDFKKTKKKITWLSNTPTVPVTLLDFDYLIFKKKLEDGDNVEDFLTPETEFRTPAIADINVLQVKKGDVIQFERKGYFIVDKAVGEESSIGGDKAGIELILIPDGRAAGVAIKHVEAKKEKKTVVATKVIGLPEVAPIVAKDSILLSEGDAGFEMKVLTKMYRVPSVIGAGAPAYPSQAKVHVVKPVYDL